MACIISDLPRLFEGQVSCAYVQGKLVININFVRFAVKGFISS